MSCVTSSGASRTTVRALIPPRCATLMWRSWIRWVSAARTTTRRRPGSVVSGRMSRGKRVINPPYLVSAVGSPLRRHRVPPMAPGPPRTPPNSTLSWWMIVRGAYRIGSTCPSAVSLNPVGDRSCVDAGAGAPRRPPTSPRTRLHRVAQGTVLAGEPPLPARSGPGSRASRPLVEVERTVSWAGTVSLGRRVALAAEILAG